MKQFNQKKSDTYFNTVFSDVQSKSINEGTISKLHFRDQLLIKHILSSHNKNNLKILDFGCGQGRLLVWLLENGYDAIGIERNVGMLEVAKKETEKFGPGRVSQGSIETLRSLKDGSFDMIIIMGVFQYLSEEDYIKLLSESKRLLKTGGKLIATFQNAFFDLFTFNKYTIDFMMNSLLFPPEDGVIKIDVDKKNAIQEEMRSLLQFPAKPEYTTTRARDNVFVRVSNPVLIDKQLEDSGFRVSKKYYYEYFGLPPLISAKFQSVADNLKNQFELNHADSWQGMFMANAFLVDMIKVDK